MTQRKIKFRAWNSNTQELIYLADSQRSEVHLQMNNEFWSVFDDIQRLCGNAINNDSVLEQYTGVKDINGIEVFEGDVVKVNKDEIGNVYFGEGSFWVGFYNEPAKQSLSEFMKYNLKTDKHDISEIEIVGKIARK
jgi:uncharacterized phage protein (TIGR01671 family)